MRQVLPKDHHPGFRVETLDKTVGLLAMEQVEKLGQDKIAGIHAWKS